MTLLNSNNPLPEKKPEEKIVPKAEEQEKKPSGQSQPSRPKQAPKTVVHKGMSSRTPKQEERKRASIFGKLFQRKQATPEPAASQPAAPAAEKKSNLFPRPKPQQVPPAAAQPAVAAPQTPPAVERPWVESSPQPASRPAPSPEAEQKSQPRNGKGINPGLRLRALESAGENTPASQPPAVEAASAQPKARPAKKQRQGGFDWGDFIKPRKPRARESLKAAWHIYRVVAAIINVVLVILVLVLALCVRYLYTTLNGVLGGLYDNFVNMDNSVISTTIPVDKAEIPLDFILPVVQSETNVTLTQSVTITGARVTINSGAITINNAPATVVLPAGTTLPVSLQMDVPVQKTLYVDLKVPIDIKLSESNPEENGQMGLHDAFYGLQNTLGPFYCIFNRDAQDEKGAVCQQGVYIPKKIKP
jgi:hypothetical protein